MKRSYLFLPAVLLAAAAQLPADVMVKSTYQTGSETETSTVYLTKDRQRLEDGNGAKLIRQSDRQRVIEIDDLAKSWVAIPTPAPAAAPAKKGGVVTVTTTVVDTGETKTILGMTARHLKSTTVSTPMPGACETVAEKVETDGWYVDIAYPDLAADAPAAGCVDDVRRNTVGPTPGYPVAFTSKTVRGKEESTFSMEVTALSLEALPASLFEPPADYTERRSVAALAAARPKNAGTLRVGVVGLSDATGKQVAVSGLAAQLTAMLNREKVQAVELGSAADAQAAHCDFVLESEVAGLSKSAVGQVTGKVLKLGGMLSRSAARPPAQDGTEALVKYKLTPMGKTEGVVDASAVGKNGSALNLKTAAQLASMATPMGLMMMRSMGGGGFGMLATQWMGGARFGSPDPAMSMIFRSLETHTGTVESPELAAVRAALQNEAKAVAASVKGS